MRRERAHEPFVWLRLAEPYPRRWMEIAKFLGNQKLLERRTPKETYQFQREVTKFLVSHGVLYGRWKSNQPLLKVLVSTEQKWKTMNAAHKLSRHCGREGMLRNVLEMYWRPEMYVDVKDSLKTCEPSEKRLPLRYDKPLKSLTVSHLWERVTMDIFYMPKTEDVYHLLLVAREYLGGWVEARPAKPGTSEKIGDFFDEDVFCCFRTTESEVVDGGAEYTQSMDLLFKLFNIRTISITPYHAATIAVIERGHRPIADALSKLPACSDKPKQMWIDHLPAVHWADRINVSLTTRY